MSKLLTWRVGLNQTRPNGNQCLRTFWHTLFTPSTVNILNLIFIPSSSSATVSKLTAQTLPLPPHPEFHRGHWIHDLFSRWYWNLSGAGSVWSHLEATEAAGGEVEVIWGDAVAHWCVEDIKWTLGWCLHQYTEQSQRAFYTRLVVKKNFSYDFIWNINEFIRGPGMV